MTKEELLSHSKDWQDGWRDVQQGNDIFMSHEEIANKSDEWKAGARYAIEHPIGRVAFPQ